MSWSFRENPVAGRARGTALEMPVPLMCGNSERQKPRHSGDKQRRRLALTEALWLGLGRRAAAAPGCVLESCPCRYLGQGWCLSTAVSVPLPLAEIKPNLAAGRRTWCAAPSLLLFNSPASTCHPSEGEGRSSPVLEDSTKLWVGFIYTPPVSDQK